MEINVVRIAVVTGASSGIGKEFAKQISKSFVTVDEMWVIARRLSNLKALRKELKNVRVRIIPCDVTSKADIENYVRMLRRYKPEIRILVNAAGFGKIGQFGKISLESQEDMVRVNCEALTKITRISLPYMAKKANIINIASAAAFLPQPSFAVYAASKAYVLSFSRALHQELKKRRISVTAVCPGPVDTEFFDVAEEFEEVKAYKKYFRVKPEKVVKKALIDATRGKTVSTYGVPMNAFRLLCKVVPQDMILFFLK